MTRRTKKLLSAGTAVLLLAGIGAGWWRWRFRTYTPAAVALDLRAAFQARNAPRPAERFLEIRYGPLTEPANRQRAFLDFFNLDHMEGLYRIVGYMQGAQRETNIAITAEWIADYRRTVSPEEKAALKKHLNSDAGRTALRRATAEYLSKDVYYRGATAPVIEELMVTLTEIQEP